MFTIIIFIMITGIPDRIRETIYALILTIQDAIPISIDIWRSATAYTRISFLGIVCALILTIRNTVIIRICFWSLTTIFTRTWSDQDFLGTHHYNPGCHLHPCQYLPRHNHKHQGQFSLDHQGKGHPNLIGHLLLDLPLPSSYVRNIKFEGIKWFCGCVILIKPDDRFFARLKTGACTLQRIVHHYTVIHYPIDRDIVTFIGVAQVDDQVSIIRMIDLGNRDICLSRE